jgi:molecular chaperone Hsp33
MVQSIAQEGGHSGPSEEEDWRRAQMLAHTVADDELVDPTLSADRLLFRLFHEEGVRVFAPQPIRFACRCNAGRLSGVLSSYGRDELAEMAENGIITARCEFCSTAYRFSLDELKKEG